MTEQRPPESITPWIAIAGGLLGLVGVAAGAFGAHGLRNAVSPRDLEIWQTGAHYQQLHAVLLVALGLWARGRGTAWATWAAALFILGIVVFSGTLYAMVLGAPRVLGAVTPLGGLALMSGWATIVVGALAHRKRNP
jgi:uncharacterized membrane protein YgdD (TMEM256/DUF423 family)